MVLGSRKSWDLRASYLSWIPEFSAMCGHSLATLIAATLGLPARRKPITNNPLSGLIVMITEGNTENPADHPQVYFFCVSDTPRSLLQFCFVQLT